MNKLTEAQQELLDPRDPARRRLSSERHNARVRRLDRRIEKRLRAEDLRYNVKRDMLTCRMMSALTCYLNGAVMLQCYGDTRSGAQARREREAAYWALRELSRSDLREAARMMGVL